MAVRSLYKKKSLSESRVECNIASRKYERATAELAEEKVRITSLTTSLEANKELLAHIFHSLDEADAKATNLIRYLEAAKFRNTSLQARSHGALRFPAASSERTTHIGGNFALLWTKLQETQATLDEFCIFDAD